jgi:hypothetical protein
MNSMHSTLAAIGRAILGSVATVLMLLATLVVPTTVLAQASAIGSPVTVGAATVRLTDVAYDPVNNIYMSVAAANNGSIRAVRYDSANNATASFIVFTGGDCCNWGQAPRIKYVSHAPNGAGGLGAFVVTWTNVGNVMAAVVSPSAVVSGPFTVSDGEKVWEEIGPAIAYSPTSQRLLIVWQTANFGIKGRIFNASGSAVTDVFQMANNNSGRDPSVAWNPITNQFGFAHTGFGGSGAFAAFRTVSVDGSLGARDTFGFTSGTYNTDIDVHSTTGRYVMAWTEASGIGSKVAEFDSNGSRTGTGVISTVLGDTTSMGLAFSPVSGTFLAVGQHNSSYEVVGVELNSRGVALQGATIMTSGGAPIGSIAPRVAARTTGAAHWLIAYSRNYSHIATQLVGTSSTGGASATTLAESGGSSGGSSGSSSSGCSGSAPFSGAVCQNGGWVSGGSSGGSSGGGDSSGCPGSAPFSGAVCQNGGWVAGGSGGSSSGGGDSSGCPGSAPFSGAVCQNGGWVPGGSGGSSSGGSSSGGCSGTAPVSGWVCVNGGWVPGGSGGGSSSGGGDGSGCPGSAPFAGAVCQNGGWVPGGSGGGSSSGGGDGSSCSGSAPFAGAVCQNGGWVPGGSGGSSSGSGCSGSAPFAGAVCQNGGWVPGGSGSGGGSSSSCSGSAPVSGWVCVSGGWVPPNHPGAGGGELMPEALMPEALEPEPVFQP